MNALLNTSRIVLAAAVFSVVLGGCDKRSATEPSGASGMGSGGTGAGNGGAGTGMASPGARTVPGSGESSSDSAAPPGKPAPAGASGK